MNSEIFIDYLQFSIDYKKAPQGNKNINSVRNYKHGVQNFDGSRSYFGNALTPDKALVIYSGNPLVMMRQEGLQTLDYIADIIESGAKISRLDMTMDLYVGDDFLNVQDFARLWLEKKITSKHAETEPTFYGTLTSFEAKLETLNFGIPEKRAKKGMVRVYDTGHAQGIARDIITRIEVEEKREKAHLSAVRCLDFGIAPTLKSRFDVDNDTWKNGIGSAVAPTHRGVQKEDSDDEWERRWTWLFSQVAPALKDAIEHDFSNNEYDRVRQFISMITPD